MVGGQGLHLAFQAREVVVVGRQSLPLMVRAREVVVVDANLLRHSNHEWETLIALKCGCYLCS